MSIKNILVSAGVALLVVVLGFAYFGPKNQAINGIIDRLDKRLGASPGNDLPGPVVKINGSPLIGLSQRFNTATTVACAFDVRGYASSSIISLGATINGVPTTTTGSRWRWYKSLTPAASTTALTDGNIVTATGTTIFATTTIGQSNTSVMGNGDNYLVLDFQGGSQPYLAIEGNTGDCSALLHSPSTK